MNPGGGGGRRGDPSKGRGGRVDPGGGRGVERWIQGGMKRGV